MFEATNQYTMCFMCFYLALCMVNIFVHRICFLQQQVKMSHKCLGYHVLIMLNHGMF